MLSASKNIVTDRLRLIRSSDLTNLQTAHGGQQITPIKSWVDFSNPDEDVEKLIYPLHADDDYDIGSKNEVYS